MFKIIIHTLLSGVGSPSWRCGSCDGVCTDPRRQAMPVGVQTLYSSNPAGSSSSPLRVRRPHFSLYWNICGCNLIWNPLPLDHLVTYLCSPCQISHTLYLPCSLCVEGMLCVYIYIFSSFIFLCCFIVHCIPTLFETHDL